MARKRYKPEEVVAKLRRGGPCGAAAPVLVASKCRRCAHIVRPSQDWASCEVRIPRQPTALASK